MNPLRTVTIQRAASLLGMWIVACTSLAGTAITGDPQASPPQIARYVAIDNVCAWPNLTVLRDGTIAAIIFGKPSHGQMAGDVECWASKDGELWEKRGHPA